MPSWFHFIILVSSLFLCFKKKETTTKKPLSLHTLLLLFCFLFIIHIARMLGMNMWGISIVHDLLYTDIFLNNVTNTLLLDYYNFASLGI